MRKPPKIGHSPSFFEVAKLIEETAEDGDPNRGACLCLAISRGQPAPLEKEEGKSLLSWARAELELLEEGGARARKILRSYEKLRKTERGALPSAEELASAQSRVFAPVYRVREVSMESESYEAQLVLPGEKKDTDSKAPWFPVLSPGARTRDHQTSRNGLYRLWGLGMWEGDPTAGYSCAQRVHEDEIAYVEQEISLSVPGNAWSSTNTVWDRRSKTVGGKSRELPGIERETRSSLYMHDSEGGLREYLEGWDKYMSSADEGSERGSPQSNPLSFVVLNWLMPLTVDAEFLIEMCQEMRKGGLLKVGSEYHGLPYGEVPNPSEKEKEVWKVSSEYAETFGDDAMPMGTKGFARASAIATVRFGMKISDKTIVSPAGSAGHAMTFTSSYYLTNGVPLAVPKIRSLMRSAKSLGWRFMDGLDPCDENAIAALRDLKGNVNNPSYVPSEIITRVLDDVLRNVKEPPADSYLSVDSTNSLAQKAFLRRIVGNPVSCDDFEEARERNLVFMKDLPEVRELSSFAKQFAPRCGGCPTRKLRERAGEGEFLTALQVARVQEFLERGRARTLEMLTQASPDEGNEENPFVRFNGGVNVRRERNLMRPNFLESVRSIVQKTMESEGSSLLRPEGEES